MDVSWVGRVGSHLMEQQFPVVPVDDDAVLVLLRVRQRLSDNNDTRRDNTTRDDRIDQRGDETSSVG